MESAIITIHDRYQLLSVIGQGKFGMVLKAHDTITGEPVAIKRATDALSLKHETKIMTYLFQNRFRKLPFIYWYGSQGPATYLVMTYYDCDLEAWLHSDQAMGVDMGTVFSQCIRILENLHKLYVLHRDIKPENFMVKQGGMGLAGIEFYLIDYGLATFWMNGDGEHVENRPQPTVTGTPKYVSYNNHYGDTISRRDDLISLGYMMMYFMYGYLPWQGSSTIAEMKSLPYLMDFLENETMCKMSRCESDASEIFYEGHSPEKNETPLYENIPSEKIRHFIEYCYSLEYDETPDYSLLGVLLMNPHQRCGFVNL